MKRSIAFAAIVLALGVGSRPAEAASIPVINVNTFGIELCPQSICGAAIFTGLLEGQVGSLREAVDLALTRYDAGRATYFEVLEAQQLLFPAEDALAQTQRDQLIAVVNLYKALGGGWNLPDPEWTKVP